MTGAELKQFVSDQGWSADEAALLFGFDRTTLFRQYKKETVYGPIDLACSLIKMLPKNKINNLLNS